VTANEGVPLHFRHLTGDPRTLRRPRAPWLPAGGGNVIAVSTDLVWGQRFGPAREAIGDHYRVDSDRALSGHVIVQELVPYGPSRAPVRRRTMIPDR
jgi:hypothetical protein